MQHPHLTQFNQCKIAASKSQLSERTVNDFQSPSLAKSKIVHFIGGKRPRGKITIEQRIGQKQRWIYWTRRQTFLFPFVVESFRMSVAGLSDQPLVQLDDGAQHAALESDLRPIRQFHRAQRILRPHRPIDSKARPRPPLGIGTRVRGFYGVEGWVEGENLWRHAAIPSVGYAPNRFIGDVE